MASPARYLVLAGLLASLMYAHADALRGMVAMWDNTPMYSFGYIVPFVALFLLWTERDRLARVAPAPSPLFGLPLLALALAFLVGGHFGGVLVAQQLAFWLALVGSVVFVFGTTLARRAGVALAYLLLMVPFWDGLTERLHLPFQKLSATVGIEMLQAVGVPAHRDGLFIYLPNITLEVARACSGVNYLVAILALGVPLAYLYLPTMGRRLLLIGSAVVIAALSNSLRVALIGVLAYFEVGSPLHGPFHVLHGLFVSGIGYVVLFIGLRVLAPSPGSGASAAQRTPETESPARPAPWQSFSTAHAGGLAAVFLLVGLGPMTWTPRPEPLVQRLEALPARLGDWTVEPALAPATPWWNEADARIHRRYGASGAPGLDVLVWYFEVQRQGKELVSYQVDDLHREATRLDARLGDAEVDVNLVRVTLDGRPRVGVFWYEIDGRLFTGRHEAQLFTLWTSVVKQQNSGAAVMVLVDEAAGRDEALLDHLRDLATKVHGALAPILPERR